MIRDRRLLPPQPWRADWPWRVHVHALGALRIERDGLPLAAAGKAQKKPLELLALLAAHPGRPLDTDAVIDQLWPSLDANAPRASLDMAVSRLRKLLDLPEAVQLAEGRLFLHPALVWINVCSFEKLADAAESGDETAAEHAFVRRRVAPLPSRRESTSPSRATSSAPRGSRVLMTLDRLAAARSWVQPSPWVSARA